MITLEKDCLGGKFVFSRQNVAHLNLKTMLLLAMLLFMGPLPEKHISEVNLSFGFFFFFLNYITRQFSKNYMVFSSIGIAAERFCVRNSGAIAVVEGTSYFKNSILTEIGCRFEIRFKIRFEIRFEIRNEFLKFCFF